MQDLPPDQESAERAAIVRWVPYLPVAAGMMLFVVFLIWAEIL